VHNLVKVSGYSAFKLFSFKNVANGKILLVIAELDNGNCAIDFI
jgi:hypothetical protein